MNPDTTEEQADVTRSRIGAFADWWLLRAKRLSDAESVASTAIVAVLALLAGLPGGIVVLVIVFVVAISIHITAVESGHYLMLWTATAFVLLLVVAVFGLYIGEGPPLLYAVGGTIALAHNELVRVNFARRRDAIIDKSVFSSSTIGVGAASLIGIIGTGIAQTLNVGNNRNWLWIVLAFVAAATTGLALVIVPVRNATLRDKERFQPGIRIPPQPLAKESISDF